MSERRWTSGEVIVIVLLALLAGAAIARWGFVVVLGVVAAIFFIGVVPWYEASEGDRWWLLRRRLARPFERRRLRRYYREHPEELAEARAHGIDPLR